MSTKSEILFICRYQLNQQITIPCSIGSTQCYLGLLEKSSKFEPSNLMKGVVAAGNNGFGTLPASEEMLYGTTIRTGTRDQLFDPIFWGRK